MTDWTPDSWQRKAVAQQVHYPDEAALARVLAEMRLLPPLVTSWEIERLRSKLAAAARGETFVLQGGDCAENFDDCRADAIAAKLKILMQMSLVLVHGTRRPVVRIGRIAGQYAKPRSADLETKDGKTLPSYRGDTVNREAFTEEDRAPDPILMLRGYERAALTLNFVRALADGGFADLHHPEYWDISFASGAATRSSTAVSSIRSATRSRSSPRSPASTPHRYAGSTSTPATRGSRCTTTPPRPARCRAGA